MFKNLPSPPQYLLTPNGLKKIQAEYDHLQATRPAAVADLQRAREMGDLSENAFYRTSRAKVSSIDSRLEKLHKIIQFAKVVTPDPNKTEADIGCWVTLKTNDQEVVYQLVGSLEADPINGKLSINSPLGRALIHQAPGTSVEITTPAGRQTYQLVTISWN